MYTGLAKAGCAMIRLFVGLELAEEQKTDLLALMHGLNGVKWQRDDQLHLTLSFIGEVPRNIARDIADCLSLVHFTPFDLSLKSVGLFGTFDKPRLLWAGVEGADALCHLQEKIEHALIGLGIDIDGRKYKPHITLARVRGRSRPFEVEQWLAANDSFLSAIMRVEHFTLFSSQLSHNGSYYHAEAQFPAEGILDPEFVESALDLPDIGAAEKMHMHK